MKGAASDGPEQVGSVSTGASGAWCAVREPRNDAARAMIGEIA
jgi:hypothetical protein